MEEKSNIKTEDESSPASIKKSAAVWEQSAMSKETLTGLWFWEPALTVKRFSGRFFSFAKESKALSNSLPIWVSMEDAFGLREEAPSKTLANAMPPPVPLTEASAAEERDASMWPWFMWRWCQVRLGKLFTSKLNTVLAITGFLSFQDG